MQTRQVWIYQGDIGKVIQQVNKDNLMVAWQLEGEERQLNMTQFLLKDGLVFCDFIIYLWKVKNTSEECGE